MIAHGALATVAHAPAMPFRRPDEQGALRDAITNLLHAAAPLAEAGDASAALAVDLARAFRVHLAVAGQREDAAEHFAVSDDFISEDVPGSEALRALWRQRGERLRPHLDARDPFSEVNIGSDWRPSRQSEERWLDGWRHALAFAAAALRMNEKELSSLASVMIAESRGWGPEEHAATFRGALANCIERVAEEGADDPYTRAIVRALPALGYNPITFLKAEKERARRDKNLKELKGQRERDPAAWRKKIYDIVVVAKGVNKKAADRLCCSLADLRTWIASDAELEKMVARVTTK